MISRREMLQSLSPLGEVVLDASRCTGCGLCARECPFDALRLSPGREADKFRIIFRYGSCFACGVCTEICPEKCLQVKRSLVPGRMGRLSVLFQDEIQRCASCGVPLGPKALMARLSKTLTVDGAKVGLPLGLCPDCRARGRPDNGER